MAAADQHRPVGHLLERQLAPHSPITTGSRTRAWRGHHHHRRARLERHGFAERGATAPAQAPAGIDENRCLDRPAAGPTRQMPRLRARSRWPALPPHFNPAGSRRRGTPSSCDRGWRTRRRAPPGRRRNAATARAGSRTARCGRSVPHGSSPAPHPRPRAPSVAHPAASSATAICPLTRKPQSSPTSAAMSCHIRMAATASGISAARAAAGAPRRR